MRLHIDMTSYSAIAVPHLKEDSRHWLAGLDVENLDFVRERHSSLLLYYTTITPQHACVMDCEAIFEQILQFSVA